MLSQRCCDSGLASGKPKPPLNFTDMDKISGLPDELLLKILSLVPTKVAVSTSILSKRWEFLWMWLPKLEYISEYLNHIHTKPGLREFIDKNLPLHRAPVIESLCLDLCDENIKAEDILRWVEIAVSRYVRELEISYYSGDVNIFPSSFYTCKSLVILSLNSVTLMDVPSMVCLSSLKTLELEDLRCEGGKPLQQLLSICPVLEELWVHFRDIDCCHLKEFTVIVPSLQSLSLFIPENRFLDGYEIDTPSLKYLRLEDLTYVDHFSLFKNMPKLREAYIDVILPDDLENLIGSITSVKRLTICSEILEIGGQDGFVFNQLEHLKLCACNRDSSNLLRKLLKDSPNLRLLGHDHLLH